MKNYINTIVFTYKSKVKSIFFFVSTIILIVAMATLMNLGKIQEFFKSDNESKPVSIIVNNLSSNFIIDEEMLSKTFENDNLKFIDDVDKAEAELNKNIENILLRIEDDETSLYKATILQKRHSNAQKVTLLNEVTEKLALYNKMLLADVESQYYGTILGDIPIEIANHENDAESKTMLAYLVIIAFFMLLTYYVQGVANIVSYEKNNRVIEVLLTSSKPIELFFGKILGNCLVSITQMLIVVLSGIGIYKISNSEPISFLGSTLDFSVLSLKQLIYIVVFFTLAYLMYSLATGALASLVGSNEDVAQITLPVTILLLISTFLAMYYTLNPLADSMAIVSQIPLVSPVIMSLRIIVLDVPDSVILLSIGSLLITCLIFAVVGSKIYSRAILSGSKKMSYKRVINSLIAREGN